MRFAVRSPLFAIRYSLFVLLAACGSTAPPPELPPPAPGVVSSGPPALPVLPNVVSSPSLLPGDRIEIKVYQQPDLDLAVTIPPNGTITFPLIGAVDPVGRTTIGLEQAIGERLGRQYLVDPKVTVIVKEYAPRTVYIYGGVQKPGGYAVPPNQMMTLLRLVALAGGYTDKAHKEQSQIIRKTDKGTPAATSISVNEVERAVAAGRAEADPLLLPDDLVVIPSAARLVYVWGYVKLPGAFEIPVDTRMTVSMAISKAGGYAKFARSAGVWVDRRPSDGKAVRIPCDMAKFVDGDVRQDIELQPGDVIHVPEAGIFK